MAAYLETARRHLARDKKAKAVEVLDRVRGLPELATSAQEALGELYQNCGEDQHALSVLRAVAEKSRAASDAESLERICNNLVPLLMTAGKDEEALEWQLDLARAQISQGMVEQARTLLEKIGETFPENRSFHEAAAAVWAQNGIPELAAQEYLSAARLCMSAKDWREARAWCRKAIDGRPREIVGRELLAQCLREMGEVQEACNVLAQLADLYEDSLQTAESAEVLARIVEIQPEEATHLERLADAFDRQSRGNPAGNRLTIRALVGRQMGRDADR